MKRFIILVITVLSILLVVPLNAWQNTPTLGVLPDSGPSLPATCVVGQIYFKTTATAGLNQCNPANTWTALSAGAGSGTVNANNGSAGAGVFYPAAAGSTTVGPLSGLTYDAVGNATIAQGTISVSTPVFSQTGTWNAAGVAFTNWLSNITCTAAATASIAAGFGTAGTQWQFKYGAANCGAPQILLPAGATANPQIASSGATNTGMNIFSSSIIYPIAGADTFAITGSNQVGLRSVGIYEWSSTTTPSASFDTGLSRSAAGMVAVGTSAQGSEAGFIRMVNSCSVVSDITLTVNTNITICQWSLPAIAKAWSWQCKIPWVISAGSGTNTISIGVNAQQTPAATTTASARILTTNTGTETDATVNLSASGAVNVLTSPTITPAATVFQSETFGTLSSNAAAGTFTITMNAAGTTATALAKAGATCWLY